MYAMPGPRFLRFAWRIAAYGGMLTRRIEAQTDESEPVVEAAPVRRECPASSRAAALAPAGAKMVSAAELAFLHPGLVELKTAKPHE